MDYLDLIDGPIRNEIPEVDVRGFDQFILKAEDGDYIVSVESITNRERINIFAPVVYYNNIPQFLPVDFVSASPGRLMRFLKKFGIPYEDILKRSAWQIIIP